VIVRSISTRGRLGILDLQGRQPHPDFRRFNLIYGWNRSGKTTLSRIFEACELKSVQFKQYPEGGVFRLESDSTGAPLTPSNIDSCELAVKVFNKDFIDRNVSFDDSACEPIVYISEEDIAARKELENLHDKTDGLVAEKDVTQAEKTAAENAVEGFLGATALSVKNTVGNLQVQDEYRNYDKRKLKALLESGEPTTFEELSEDGFEVYRALISSEPKSLQSKASAFTASLSIGDETFPDLQSIHSAIEEVAGREVVSKTLKRLEADPELNGWVRRGFQLQIERDEQDTCPYCEQELDPSFLQGLAQHFSDDYEALVRDLRTWIDALGDLTLQGFRSDIDLYPEFGQKYSDLAGTHTKLLTELEQWREKCTTVLQRRLDNPIKPASALASPPEEFTERHNAVVERLNDLLDEHNEKAHNHTDEVSAKKRLLTEHIVAEAMRTQDYAKMQDTLRQTGDRTAAAGTALDDHHSKIDELMKATSNIGAALERINGHLADFFGGDEILLELDAPAKGYIIRRDGRAAENLSEGEKTAIAFAYFIAKTQERDFRVGDGVIVIDDPVSSLDSNYIYHCFALIQRHFKTAGQLFVLTHNFELFNLTKLWFKDKNQKSKRRGQPDVPCAFLTIETELNDNERVGHLAAMDATIRDYNSEYQYLFARLCHFCDDATPGYADLYTVGNIARRFLEIYAGFKVPSTADLRGKVEQLPTKEVSDVQKDKLYRLVQAYSHADEPTCAVVHKDRCEVQEAVRVLLAVVKESDPEHYRILRKGLPQGAGA